MEEIYKVTEADLIGDIEGFPIEVVHKMVERQVEQGHTADVEVFQRDRINGVSGFIWRLTEEGIDFWSDVIDDRNFDEFFSLYPRQGESMPMPRTKPIKFKHIAWTRQQKWIIERLPQTEKPSLLARLAKVGHLAEGSCYYNGFAMPMLIDAVDAALNLFGSRGDEHDIIAKISRIRYAVNTELLNIGRIYDAFFNDCDLHSINMCVNDATYEGVRRCALMWLKKNPWVAQKLTGRIRFCGINHSIAIEEPKHVSHIPYGCRKETHDIYKHRDRFIIGDTSYLIH